ncbi:SDR family oxidoreductase [Salinibacterium sp. TMP30]|uniref:SDR family NAD(P)-dependent oxidoreductase n=1 Tax=Salinibacterium sp. TMP30 TaxID=3138237 RepID=UPI00313A42E9
MPERIGGVYPNLEGKVVLVTGAAQGMGAMHARRLFASGATLAVNDRETSAELEALATELSGLAVPGDVSDPDQVRAIVQRVEKEIGTVDVLVANHAFMSMGPLVDADLADWWKVMDTNLGGTFHLIQAVLPGMRRRGAGRIVVISSEWGVTGWPNATAYSASKAGLISLVKTLGRELAPEGIIVNAVAPGVTDTAQLEVDARSAGISLDEMRTIYASTIPLGRIGTPSEIAAAVALLCDFRLSAIIGQVVQVNGGSTRGRA